MQIKIKFFTYISHDGVTGREIYKCVVPDKQASGQFSTPTPFPKTTQRHARGQGTPSPVLLAEGRIKLLYNISLKLSRALTSLLGVRN